MKKNWIAWIFLSIFCTLFFNLGWAKSKDLAKVPTPVRVKVSVVNLYYVTTISICNISNKVIPLTDLEFHFNYGVEMPSNIWGQPWLDWKVVSQEGNAVVLKGGSAFVPPLNPDPDCKNPITIQFNASPDTPLPYGPFVLKAEGGEPAESGTLIVKTPAAPAPDLPSPDVTITGPDFFKEQIINWESALQLDNLSVGTYTIVAAPVDNGTDFFVADQITAEVESQKTTTANIVYKAVPSGNVLVKLIDAPSEDVPLSLTGKKYTFNKTVSDGTTLTLPEDTYTVSSNIPGFNSSPVPNPLTVPTDTKLTITYTRVTMPGNGPFTTINGNIVDKNNQPVTFKGVSWFGFNTGNHIVHGLWQSDFSTMLGQIKSLGFNAIRLPFAFDFILNPSLKPNGITTVCGGKPCNEDVPQDSALHTFQWVVQQFTDNGIYVMLDDHYEDNLYFTNQKQWVVGWQKIAQMFINNPLVGYDLYNEPDSHGLTWEDRTSGVPWQLGTHEAASAIYAIDTKKLIFIEGTAQGRLRANWGDGLATDKAAVTEGVSNPKDFFINLAHAPYIKQTVVSPHIYGPNGTNNQGPDHSDEALAWSDWSRLNGYLFNNFLRVNDTQQSGFCIDGDCHLYPIALGEFGGKFDSADPYYEKDKATMINIATYLNRLGQGKPANPSWFYWCWNPNSGNTGGILKDDWATIDCNKVNYLKKYLGLVPKEDVCS